MTIAEKIARAHKAAVADGVSPTHLFLGSQEIDELLDHTGSFDTLGSNWKRFYQGGKPATRPSINYMGMAVVPMIPPGVFVAAGAWA